MTIDDATEIEAQARRAVGSFWDAVEAWDATRRLAGSVPGGPQHMARVVMAAFADEMADRDRNEAWLRGAVSQVARLGLRWLVPNVAEYLDLSTLGASPPPAAREQPAQGPEGPAGP